MEVLINEELYRLGQKVLEKEPFEIDPPRFDWKESFFIDLANVSEKIIRKLRECYSDANFKEAKLLVRDIDHWLRALTSEEELGSVRSRTVRQSCALLIQYIGLSDRKHIYQRVYNGDNSVLLPYYVEEIEYTPPRKERSGDYTPEHVTIKLHWEQFEELDSTSVTFWPEHCLGRTAQETLKTHNYFLETKELRKEHEWDLQRYSTIHKKIGEQYLISGLADTEDVDGNGKGSWWDRRTKNFIMGKDGAPEKVVVDIFSDSEEDEGRRRSRYRKTPYPFFWQRNKCVVKRPDKELEWNGKNELTEGDLEVDVPIHPFLVVFSMRLHLRLRVHVADLLKYKYNTKIRDSLVLPKANRKLIDTLLSDGTGPKFQDVIQGKSGGMIILCQGPPGTGKTLTAEVYSEVKKRPLYTVQCSQLGVDPEELEENLQRILTRGERWNAVTLLDEADVYLHQRGDNLQQNAIVGVFLRVLEYHSGVLFLTTNRSDLVDDAIQSRCAVRIPYKVPGTEMQKKIWRVLARVNGLQLEESEITKIVAKYPHLPGRTVKNLLKLASVVAAERKSPITSELVSELTIFNPTS